MRLLRLPDLLQCMLNLGFARFGPLFPLFGKVAKLQICELQHVHEFNTWENREICSFQFLPLTHFSVDFALLHYCILVSLTNHDTSLWDMLYVVHHPLGLSGTIPLLPGIPFPFRGNFSFIFEILYRH